MHPLERQQLREALGALEAPLAAEVVRDRADGVDELLQVGRRADVPGHSEHLRAVRGQVGAEEQRRRLGGALAPLVDEAGVGTGGGSRTRRDRRRRGRRRRARGRPCPRCGPRRRRRGSGRRSRDRARRSLRARRTRPGRYERAFSAASRSTSRSQRPSPRRSPSARGSRTSSGSGEPGSKRETSTRDRQVDLVQEAPEHPLGRGRRRERLDHAHLATGEAVLPLVLDAVERVALDFAVDLDGGVELLAGTAPPALRVGETVLLPPALVAREHPGPSDAHALVDGAEERERLVGVDEPDRAGGICPQREARASPTSCARSARPARNRSGRRSTPRTPRAPRSARPSRARPASCRFMKSRRIPRRRCVGITPTQVTPAQGSCPPGIVRSNAYAPASATGLPRRRRPSARDAGSALRSRSQSSSSMPALPNATSAALIAARSSSSAGGRMSIGIACDPLRRSSRAGRSRASASARCRRSRSGR